MKNNKKKKYNFILKKYYRTRLKKKTLILCRDRILKCFKFFKIMMGTEKMFTFDYIFSSDSHQTEIYKSCIENLLNGCFEGYNASILAYGQTGSGKTYTMGSNNWTNVNEEELGIIPRVIRNIFFEIDKKKEKVEFVVKASFLEIYNEEIVDLLDRKNKLTVSFSPLHYFINHFFR